MIVWDVWLWPIAEMPAARLHGCLLGVNLPARTAFVNPVFGPPGAAAPTLAG